MSTSPETLELIRGWAAQGIDLNGIQKNLADADIQIRFMELRFLMLDHEIEVAKPVATPAPLEEAAAEPAAEVANSPKPASEVPMGGMKIQLDDIQIPGTMLSGKAIFPSGIRGAWQFDQSGQFGWSDLSAEPSHAELSIFQRELSAILSKGQ